MSLVMLAANEAHTTDRETAGWQRSASQTNLLAIWCRQQVGWKGGERTARIWADLPVVMKGSARQKNSEDGCDVAGQNEDEPKLDAEAVIAAEAVLDTRESCQFVHPNLPGRGRAKYTVRRR